MNNVGETSHSPIDPFDLSKDGADPTTTQRHRLLLYGSVNSPRGRPATPGK